MKWIKASLMLPALTQDPGSWPKSEPVLVFDGIQRVAYYEQIDETCSPQWRSNCSEGWILDHVTAWMPLPGRPT